ncbi:MAG: outer membrane protein assembly factor BamE [Verrucomicrobiota bacterium]
MKLLAITMLALALAGCASVGRKLDTAKIDQIKKGETTREEIQKWFGSPDQITKDANGNTTYSYMYVRATAKPETYIPLVGAFAGGANVQNQSLMVTFGDDGKVKDMISTYGSTESGTGASAGSKAKMDTVEKDKRPR